MTPGPSTEPPGKTRRVTLAEVAKAAGVSVMTASYSYNQPARVSDNSRRRVLAAAEALGYAGPNPSARALRRGSTGALGVVLGEHLLNAFDDPEGLSLLSGIASVCVEHGYAMMLLPTAGSSANLDRIKQAAVDAFVVFPASDDDAALRVVRSTHRPMVVHNRPLGAGPPAIETDNVSAHNLTIADDVEVAGWDGSTTSGALGLSTLSQSLEDQGAACARRALELI